MAYPVVGAILLYNWWENNNERDEVLENTKLSSSMKGIFGAADNFLSLLDLGLMAVTPFAPVSGIVGFASAFGFNLAFESVVEKFEIIDEKEVNKNEALKYLLEMNKYMDEAQKSIEKKCE